MFRRFLCWLFGHDWEYGHSRFRGSKGRFVRQEWRECRCCGVFQFPDEAPLTDPFCWDGA